jgi:hypothetical protein
MATGNPSAGDRTPGAADERTWAPGPPAKRLAAGRSLNPGQSQEARVDGRIHADAYRLAWSDEFDGAPGTPADRETWRAETGGSG